MAHLSHSKHRPAHERDGSGRPGSAFHLRAGLHRRPAFARGYGGQAVAVQERDLNPACERGEPLDYARDRQTGREPGGRVPKGRNAAGGRNSDDDFGDANEVVYYLASALINAD